MAVLGRTPAARRVIGIDPGSTVTGYGIVEARRDGRLCAVACGVVRPDAGPFAARLSAIYDGLKLIIAEHEPTEAALEDIFYAANVRSALKLGHARGVAVLAAAHAGLPVAAYSPMEVKQSLVGYGRAEKGQVGRMVCVLLGLAEPPKPLDASDALAVAICHIHGSRIRALELRAR